MSTHYQILLKIFLEQTQKCLSDMAHYSSLSLARSGEVLIHLSVNGMVFIPLAIVWDIMYFRYSEILVFSEVSIPCLYACSIFSVQQGIARCRHL